MYLDVLGIHRQVAEVLTLRVMPGTQHIQAVETLERHGWDIIRTQTGITFTLTAIRRIEESP